MINSERARLNEYKRMAAKALDMAKRNKHDSKLRALALKLYYNKMRDIRKLCQSS